MNKLILCLWLSLSSNIFADTTLSSQEISRIGTGWGSEGIYFFLKENNKIEECESKVVRIDKNQPMLKDILSVGLSALLANKKVDLRVSGCKGTSMVGIAITIIH